MLRLGAIGKQTKSHRKRGGDRERELLNTTESLVGAALLQLAQLANRCALTLASQIAAVVVVVDFFVSN